jgi:hypothetical protein
MSRNILTNHRVIRTIPAALVILGLATAGCAKDDDPIPPAINPAGPGTHTVRMVLTVGAQTIEVAPSAQFGSPILLPLNTATTVTARWLNSEGKDDPDASPSKYELSFTADAGVRVSFTRSTSNPFSGTLTATAATAAGGIRFGLRQVKSDRFDFGPFLVLVKTQ